MKFVSETLIDQALVLIEQSPENYNLTVEELQKKQAVLLSYLLGKDISLFTEDERSYLLFICLVCWKAITQLDSSIDIVHKDKINSLEEKNWEVISEVKSKRFRDRITVFFENYPQEDLLAFVEDMLVQDDDGIVTKEGREYLFITAKTFIDCLIG